MEIVGSRLALISTQLNSSLFAMVALLRIAVSAQTQPIVGQQEAPTSRPLMLMRD